MNRKQKIVILGSGESGVGTAILAAKRGYDVFVSDRGKIEEKHKNSLIELGVEWEQQKHSEEKIFTADLVMKSPGIPEDAPLINRLRGKGIKVISEIEFASGYTDATIVGITGSNGKTTTTSLVHHILNNGGLDVAMAGNIGKSFARQVAVNPQEYFVLELSSFQLDGIEDFRPHIAVLTNITPDHLDRYNHNFKEYISSKFRIVKNQTEEDFFIYDSDNEIITDWLEEFPVRSKKLPFSLKNEVENGAFIKDDKITVNIDNNKFIMPTSTLALEGKHNAKNAMAAATVAQLLRIRKETIRESLENFHGVEHRLEKVLKINNVQYINDSKATNINATYYALESMESETVWIVGGVDKGNDYSELLALVNEKVKAIVCLGVDNERIISAFGNCVDNIVEAQSMDDAVKFAYQLAVKGDTVLLSPACASFDLFKNYEDRGIKFKEAVRNL
ncbi:MAG TPA: UDP-N-acetylmuramoyl-L-alanine--D-glutamate ligase [Salinimicrobium sp.]|nr:UDP-N-acetylmuramoyl-L-alanine--D-glutamate ligase [Salinimicrobium sp.]